MNITVLLTGESMTTYDTIQMRAMDPVTSSMERKSVHLVDLRNPILIYWPYTPFSKNEP